MREILFRGKRKDNGEWVYGDFVRPSNICFATTGYDEATKQENAVIWNEEAVLPNTVGQYTGIDDKNGKKIFEGDIIAFHRFSVKDGSYKELWSICYQKYMSCFALNAFKNEAYKHSSLLKFCETCYEVIGNIHDNPELLEEKE